MTTGYQRDQSQPELPYENSFAHLAEELKKLDLMIERQVLAFRLELPEVSHAAASHPMAIFHAEVDQLLSQNRSVARDHPELDDYDTQLHRMQAEIENRVRESVNRGGFLALPRLAYLFGLSAFESQAVVVCLAPELERKYDTLYAYLQDDITRKRPSVDLMLDLLCRTESERWHARGLFSESAPLLRLGILHKSEDRTSPSGSSGLAQFLSLDPRILGYLLGHDHIDARLVGLADPLPPLPSLDRVPVDPGVKERLRGFLRRHFSLGRPEGKGFVFHFRGPRGVGKRDLARGLCGQLACPLLTVDTARLGAGSPDREILLPILFREGLLRQAAIYLDNADALLKDDDTTRAVAKRLGAVIGEFGWLTFLAGEKPWPYAEVFEQSLFHAVELAVPDVPIRQAAWEQALQSVAAEVDATWAGRLACQFRLTPGQIQEAATFASKQHDLGGGEGGVTLADLFKACRAQSNQKLGDLALRIDPRYRWEDLVLPEDTVAHLKEITSQVEHRYQVFGEWGFGEKLSHGKGLSVLFSGPPGTGKTMAAEVIAHELGLDLYKIDLSGIVSKYIGETEKNLARVFREAETSNAILFFDEADALFGKRTEVSDAHDRYANIETSYLLQKMDEYEGVVILATNLRENLDEAFTRRLRFVVEFPFPDELSRCRIWQGHFPEQAPVGADVDCGLLAKCLAIAGGNIKNIVLNAAFLAAEDSGVIGMKHIVHGAKREFEKIGKLWTGDLSSG